MLSFRFAQKPSDRSIRYYTEVFCVYSRVAAGQVILASTSQKNHLCTGAMPIGSVE